MNRRAGIIGEFARNGLGVPVLVMVILAMMVLPLPAFLLDVLFTFNISLSLMVLLGGDLRAPRARVRELPDGAARRDAAAPRVSTSPPRASCSSTATPARTPRAT